MKKLTALVMVMVAAGVLLSGCYSKNCDATCPAVKANMQSVKGVQVTKTTKTAS